MLKFSPKIRKAYLADLQTLKDIEELHAKVKTFLRSTLQAADTSVVAKIPHKAWLLLQIGLWRGLELTEGSVREINAHAVVSSFVLARSLFEVASLMFFAWEKVEEALTSPLPPDLTALDGELMTLATGTRDKEWLNKDGAIPAKNILTIIDRVSKTLEFARDHYDQLSEFVHPNISGMMLMYHRPHIEEQQSTFHNSWEENQALLPTLLAAIAISLTMIDHALTHFERHLPNFIRVCEEGIYRRGTWPQDVPYRWSPQ